MALWPKMWKVGLCLAESLPVIRGIGSYMTLRDLAIGETAVITAVGGEGALRQHLLDMGVIPGSFAKVIKFAPMGDPVEIQIHGYLLTRVVVYHLYRVEVFTTHRGVAVYDIGVTIYWLLIKGYVTIPRFHETVIFKSDFHTIL